MKFEQFPMKLVKGDPNFWINWIINVAFWTGVPMLLIAISGGLS